MVGAALVLTMTAAACAPSEQPLLEQFFAASRLRDKTALQAFSSVIFEPREQGIVRTFTITAVSPERAEADGNHVKDVTVVAPVVMPDGKAVQKTLVVTLQRATNDRPTGYPWIIVRVAER